MLRGLQLPSAPAGVLLALPWFVKWGRPEFSPCQEKHMHSSRERTTSVHVLALIGQVA